MTEPLTAARLTELRRQIGRAHTELGEVCAEGPPRRFKMTVPADPERDSDLIISAGLDAGETLAAEVERLREAAAWYRCPRCQQTGRWTDGTSVAAGDERDEYWCQNCGVEVLLVQATEMTSDEVVAKLREDLAELTRRRTDDLNVRGLLSPNPGPRRVPFDLGEELAPAIEWLLAENERLERDLLEAQGRLADAQEAARG